MPELADLRPLTAGLPPIVILSSLDFGGAGVAALRLHQGLVAAGADCKMIVLKKQSNDPTVGELSNNGVPLWDYACSGWQNALRDYPNRPAGLEMFSTADAPINVADLDIVKNAGLVNLHWCAGMLKWPEAGNGLRGKPVVWTLHDMNPFTGGCHYAGTCEKWRDGGCAKCPQLGSNISENDLAKINFQAKLIGYKGINFYFTSSFSCCLNWLKTSPLFNTSSDNRVCLLKSDENDLANYVYEYIAFFRKILELPKISPTNSTISSHTATTNNTDITINYNYKVDINQKNNSHTQCINLITPNSKVLDFGCAIGALGEYLHNEKKCEVIGADISQKFLDIASSKKCYEKLYKLNFDNLNDELLSYTAYFDYILIADVIEHLKKPELFLSKVVKYIKKNGKIIMSIPNIAHGSIVLNLLRNKFVYTDMGLLDKTHIRFFTRNSIIELMNKLHLCIEKFSFVIQNYNSYYENVNLNEYSNNEISVINSNPYSFVYQFIIEISTNWQGEAFNNNQLVLTKN